MITGGHPGGEPQIAPWQKLKRRQTKRYDNPVVEKFRRIVEKHLLSRPLAEIQKLAGNRVDITLLGKMARFKEALESMFPEGDQGNIGSRLAKIGKNIFLNEFLNAVLEESPGLEDQAIIRQHFTLNSESEVGVGVPVPSTPDKTIDKTTDKTACNLIDKTTDKKVNLNNLFNS